jgi:hypothetical protein
VQGGDANDCVPIDARTHANSAFVRGESLETQNKLPRFYHSAKNSLAFLNVLAYIHVMRFVDCGQHRMPRGTIFAGSLSLSLVRESVFVRVRVVIPTPDLWVHPEKA